MRNGLRTRIIGGLCAALLVTLVGASTAVADPTLAVQVPTAAQAIGAPVSIVYVGSTEVGADTYMTLWSYYVRGGSTCAPTVAAERAASGAQFDADQYVEAPAPFSLTSTVRFDTAGAYLFCAYLQGAQVADNAPPSATAQATVQVGAPAAAGCTVPSVTGLSLAAATKKLVAADCLAGKVTKPKKAGKKKLVVKSQSKPAGTKLALRTKIDLVLKVQTAKK